MLSIYYIVIKVTRGLIDMAYGIETSKTLYAYDVSDETNHDLYLTRSIGAAQLVFSDLLNDDDLLLFYENGSNPITIKSVNADGKSIVVDGADYIYTLSRIIIDGHSYTISDCVYDIDNNEYTLYIGKGGLVPLLSDEFTCILLNELEIIWGYCLLYQFTISARELVLREILYSRDRYVDGSLLPAEEGSLQKLRKDYLSEARKVINRSLLSTGNYSGNVMVRG